MALVIRSAGSGEVLAEFEGDEFQEMVQTHRNTVKALKLKLQDKGFGSRFQLRILNDLTEMQDDDTLVPPLDLKLMKMSLLSDVAENKMFFEACGDGRLEEVETRLQNLQDPNVEMRGRTALHLSASDGHLEVVRLLLEAGASYDRAANDSTTPLHIAAILCHWEVVRLLLEKGASCHQAASDGTTPLHEAARMGHVEMARLLLKAGASCHEAANDGITPLHEAAREGNVEVVRLLLDARASCDQLTNNGATPLQLAAANSHQQVVCLLEGARWGT